MNIVQILSGLRRPTRYDTEAITLLSNKRLLAKLLKEVVPEVQKYSVQEIVGFISDEKIQKVGVHPGTKLFQRIRGLTTESKIINEGVVRFDLVLNLDIAKKSQTLRIIVNVEAQGNSHPGYDLVTRAIYYCCRLISEQHETEFSDSNYDDIKKVYSIWICMPKKKKESSIESYDIQRHQDFEKSKPDVRYDLLKAIIIRLGKNFSKERTFLDELSVLFSDTISVEKKMLYLQQDKELIGEEASIRKGLENMSGLGQSIYDDGYGEGMTSGVAKGIEQGINLGKLEMIKSMLEKNFSKEQIADVAGVSLEELDEILSEEKEKD